LLDHFGGQAPKLGSWWANGQPLQRLRANSQSVSSGQPDASNPAAQTADGLPVGLSAAKTKSTSRDVTKANM
jgi:hypothetical protein